MVRDQLVIDVWGEEICKGLLANTELTFQEAINVLEIEEMVERDAKRFHHKPVFIIAFK